MIYIRKKGTDLYLTRGGEFVSLIELDNVLSFTCYVTAAEFCNKIEGEIHPIRLEITECHEIIKRMILMDDIQKQMVLIGGIKEHKRRIKELNEENNNLKEQIKHLRNQISSFSRD